MDLTIEAIMVAGGHMTDPPSSITYSSIVSRDSMKFSFMIADLNGLNILALGIRKHTSMLLAVRNYTVYM